MPDARRVRRWLGRAVAVVAAVVALAVVGTWAQSERVIRRAYAAPADRPLAVPRDAASIAEGERLARTRGCFACHGPALAGRVFFDEPGVARLVAPNLTAAARRYSDDELARIIRRGVRPDGRSVWAMPSDMFVALSDADLARLVAYLRHAPPAAGPGPSIVVGPMGRVGVVTGKFAPSAEHVRRQRNSPARETPTGDSLAHGRYLALTSCAECHGARLRGDGATTPSLAVTAAYTPAEFARLMRTGTAKGGREVGFMSGTARARFAHFTDAEVRALHAYLRTLAGA
jgi:mono/diheme cytochrome c family protein